MKTTLARFAQIRATLSALLFLLTGCSTTPAPTKDVTLSLTKATLQQYESRHVLTCTIVLDNRTGRTLFVTTQFHSPFDHLRPMIYDEQENLLYDGFDINKPGNILDHRSPSHVIGKPYPLARGRTTNELIFLLPSSVFPFSKYPATYNPSANVTLAGFLTGSTYPHWLRSQTIPVTTATSEPKLTSRSYFWEAYPP